MLSQWFEAAQSNDAPFIQNNRSQFSRQRDPEGNTALMIAAGNGRCDIVDQLYQMEYGLKNELGQTALMLAAIRGCRHCVQCLVQLEAGQLTHQGKSALMMALFYGKIAVAKLLLPHELHINYNTQPPESFLQQQSTEADQLKAEIAKIKSEPLWPLVAVALSRADSVEIIAYRAAQTAKRMENELKQREVFSEQVSVIEHDVRSNKSAQRRPPVAPKPSVYAQKSFEQMGQVVQKKAEFEQNVTALKSDLGKLQTKMSSLEKSVKSSLPATNQIEFLHKKQNDTETVLNEVIANVEDLKQSLAQVIEYNGSFGKTVMTMLQEIATKMEKQDNE